ncbi:MAG: hypothetical protein R3338_12775, partial [Thermoanaerobaculia bacterium]|nr:hypothetical protein [Thermoanaerobaculia bacterium]
FTLRNDGNSTVYVSFDSPGPFYEISPTSRSLQAGTSADFTVKPLDTVLGEPGAHADKAVIHVEESFNDFVVGEVPIRLLVTERPESEVRLLALASRVSVASGPNQPAQGTVQFFNPSDLTLTALVSADVPWIIPDTDQITVGPDETVTVSFTIDPAQFPSAGEGSSASGRILLLYLAPGAGKKGVGFHADEGTSSSSTAVTYTIQPTTTLVSIPELSPEEVVLFVAGAGHVVGSVGTFISDLSLVSRSDGADLRDVDLYYLPRSVGSESAVAASLSSVGPAPPITMSDLVNSVFNRQDLGSIQIRSADVEDLSVAASVIVSSDPAGTFGTSLPAFRSDRGVEPGGSQFITGLRRDESGHTNLYVQEMSGASYPVSIDFYLEDGTSAGAQSVTLAPFGLVVLGDVVPEGAVSAVLSSDGSAGGRFLAHATPVDRASKDTWVVTDWTRHYGYARNEPVVIPIAGAVHGANDTYFRTDVAVMNAGSGEASGLLRYHPRGGEVIERQVRISERGSSIMNDVTATTFEIDTDTVGHLTFTPQEGELVLTSRTYTTVQGDVATYGSGVPALPMASALRMGDRKRFGGIEDATVETINDQTPASYRTNLGVVELTGSPVQIRVTISYVYPLQAVAVVGTASRGFEVGAGALLFLNNVAAAVMGENRELFGDLRNLRVDVEVIGGDGSVMVFASSTDNGTASVAKVPTQRTSMLNTSRTENRGSGWPWMCNSVIRAP